MAFKLPSFKDLNQTQKTLIQLLPKSDKLAVIGGPGTGKTIVGVQGVVQMLGKGKKCLFLSYSRTFKYFLENIIETESILAKYKDEVIIQTFHKWFWNFMKTKFDLTNEQLKMYQDQEYVWNIKKLENFFDSCGLTENELFEYDYLFIDEAQDIQDGMMKILKRIAKNIFVTYDDSQKVGFEDKDIDALEFDHSNILNDLGIGDRFYDLIDNYRNTKEIESVAKDFLSTYDENEMSLIKTTAKRTGSRPKLIKSSTDLSEIAKYIVEHYDHSKSLAILFGNDNRDRGREIFDELFEYLQPALKEKLLYKYGWKHSNINSKNALSNSVFLMTMKTSKGLEFDDVYIIADNFDIEKIVGRNSLYVSLTRAKEMASIFMLPPIKTNSKINPILSSKLYMFKEENI